jgi:hypothetical protein
MSAGRENNVTPLDVAISTRMERGWGEGTLPLYLRANQWTLILANGAI